MKITFIMPAIGKKKGAEYMGTWKMQPLTIAVLKALTPEKYETEFFDDRLELIDYNTRTDLVVIPVETYTARRSYHIAEQFRARGVRVVLGGYHVTLVPDEAAQYCDCVMAGNAEPVFSGMLREAENGALKPRYDGAQAFSPALPDKRVFAGKRYLPISLEEIGRGCCHSCDFCAISAYYGRRYHARPLEECVGDIARSEHKFHFLVDDNLVADRAHFLQLLERITPLGIKWAGQGTLSMAGDAQLLRAMRKSGCELILIGFESLQEETLRAMNKQVNIAVRERDEYVKRIHDAGIGIYATFVFGYDFDTEQTFEQTMEFAKRHRFYTGAFNHLLPFPGTAVYDRLREQGRLLTDKWWLAENYHYGELAFRPKNLKPERLAELCYLARREFAAAPTVLRRGLAAMQRSTPLMWSLFWAMNLRLGGEVDSRMDVHLGENLDEMPK